MDSGLPGSDLRRKRQHGVQLAAFLSLAVVVLRYLPGTGGMLPFSVPESLAYDLAFGRAQPSPPSDIAIVAIDEPSLQALGQFPFPRTLHARLLDQLKEARVVAFDVLFIEPDRGGPPGDAALAEAMRRHGRVVLSCYKQARAQAGTGWSWRTRRVEMPPELASRLQSLNEANLAGPIPELAAAAAGLGYVDLEPDADGVYRRFAPARVTLGGSGVVPHFGVEIARVAGGNSDQGGWGLSGVATSSDGTTLINYCGPPGTVPMYSYAKVLAGEHAADLKDKIVIVGATAAGLFDMRPAPYRSAGRKFFGVETNANVVNTILHRPPLRDETRSLLWLGLALLLGVAAAVLVWSGGETAGPLLGVALVALIAVPSFFVAFHRWGIVIPYGAVLWATVLPVAVGAVERMGAERRMIKRQFAAYVSAEVLAELMRDPELVRQGQRRPVTVLFSDIRGSTALSESLPPETWIAQLNEYLSTMSAAIFEHDGYLDKFMGDGIMAVWNTFGTQPNHAELALGAAERMVEILEALNAHWAAREDRASLRIGIGLHCGEAIVGNVGSDRRTQYTVIGDVVNTASRVEGMTKEYQTVILLSEALAERLPDRSRLREIGEVAVRGREGTVRIFTLGGNGIAASVG